jgi:hypothetical protein
MTASISKTNNGAKLQQKSHPNASAKSYSKFKSCDVTSVLQTIRRLDQKYSQKPDKQHKVIPVQNDVLSALHTDNISSSDTNSRRGTNMSFDVKHEMVKSSLLQSSHSNLKYSHKTSRLLSPVDFISVNSRKGISKSESFDIPKNSEFDNNKSEFSLRNPLTNVQNSSHNEVHSKSNNYSIQEEARPPVQTVFTRSENVSFKLSDRVSEILLLPKDTTSKVEVQSGEMLQKSQISRNSSNVGHDDLISREYLQMARNVTGTEQTSRVPVSEKTGYQISPKVSQLELCDEINSGLGDDSVQGNFSFKIMENEDSIISSFSNSAVNIFTNSEAVPNSNLGHLHNTSFLLKSCTDQCLPSTNVPTLETNISLHCALDNAKKATQLESTQENSFVSELSNSNILSTGSHGPFKSLPYKILTIEDLFAAHEMQKPEEEKESSGNERGVKGSKENRTVSANKDNFNNGTRKMLHSEREHKTMLESREEVNDEIEEEIEEENSHATNINDFSVKTNSSYAEIMDQLSACSETEYTLQQGLSKDESVSSGQTNISSRSFSSQVVSNKSQQEDSDMENVLTSSVKSESMNKTVSTSHGSGLPSLAKPHSHLDSEESGSHRPKSNEAEIMFLEDTKYCSIGTQTDINEAYHPVLCTKNEIRQSSHSQPVMHSDGEESHSLPEIIPMYRYYSRTEGQG